MDTNSYEMTRVATPEEVRDGPVGCFCYDGDGNIVIHTPDHTFMSWNITDPFKRPHWQISGSADKPTLIPSLETSYTRTRDGMKIILWHGFVHDGWLRPV